MFTPEDHNRLRVAKRLRAEEHGPVHPRVVGNGLGLANGSEIPSWDTLLAFAVGRYWKNRPAYIKAQAAR